VSIYPYVQIFGDGLIEIGDNVSIGTGTIIYASQNGGVKIGSNTSIAAQCYIIDMDHGMDPNMRIRDQKNTVATVEIGEDCWLGANVTVLKGSTIHNGAVVGAKALVNGELPPYSINVGIPARTIKYRT
jgi:acetyltransferase-like isoleucine patch superfamily enzyme